MALWFIVGFTAFMRNICSCLKSLPDIGEGKRADPPPEIKTNTMSDSVRFLSSIVFKISLQAFKLIIKIFYLNEHFGLLMISFLLYIF